MIGRQARSTAFLKRTLFTRCLRVTYVPLSITLLLFLGATFVPSSYLYHTSTVSLSEQKECGSNTSSSAPQTRDVEWLMSQPNPVNVSKTSVCVRLGGLAAVGGIESWFFSLARYVLSVGQYRLHAVTLEASHWLSPSLDEFYWARAAINQLFESNVRINIGMLEMNEECDVVISSWVDPPLVVWPPSITTTTTSSKNSLKSRFSSIMVIHGSDAIEREGTWLYAHYLDQYDAIVCVSSGCVEAYRALAPPSVPFHYIPSAIDLDNYAPDGINPYDARSALGITLEAKKNKKNSLVIGFLGRIAEDKNPQLFVDVVHALPDNWVGVMAGPLYKSEQMVNMTRFSTHQRVQYIGDVSQPWKFLAAVDALYVSSKKEGGPVVLLEAWAMKTPIFMRHTGLAVGHEQGVFIVPEEKEGGPQAIAAFIDAAFKDDSRDEMKSKIEYGYKTVREKFSTDVLREKYHALMSSLMTADGNQHGHRLSFYVHYPKGKPPSLEALQITRRGRTILARCFYKNCPVYIRFSPGQSYTSRESRGSAQEVFTVPAHVAVSLRLYSAVSNTLGLTENDDNAGYIKDASTGEKLVTLRQRKGGEEDAAARLTTVVNLKLSSPEFVIQLAKNHAIHILDVYSLINEEK